MKNMVDNVNAKVNTLFSFGKVIYLIGMLLVLLSFMLPIFNRYLDKERVWVSYNLFNGEITTIGFFIVIAWIASIIFFYFQMFDKKVPNSLEFAKKDIIQLSLTSVLFSYFLILFGVVSSFGKASLGLYTGTFGSILMLLGGFFIYKNIVDIDGAINLIRMHPMAEVTKNTVDTVSNNQTESEKSSTVSTNSSWSENIKNKDKDKNKNKKEDVSFSDYDE